MIYYLRGLDVASLMYSPKIGVIDLVWAFVEFPDVECTNGIYRCGGTVMMRRPGQA
jgi:hypothetical protein